MANQAADFVEAIHDKIVEVAGLADEQVFIGAAPVEALNRGDAVFVTPGPERTERLDGDDKRRTQVYAVVVVAKIDGSLSKARARQLIELNDAVVAKLEELEENNLNGTACTFSQQDVDAPFGLTDGEEQATMVSQWEVVSERELTNTS